MAPDSQPPLPRRPDDPANLKRLREEARQRMDREDRPPATVYGGAPPPAPVYGGAPVVTRRWTLRGIVLLVAGVLAALAAIVTGKWLGSRVIGAVYGGPPVRVPPEPPIQTEPKPEPTPPPPTPDPRHAAPVYGGPVLPKGKQ